MKVLVTGGAGFIGSNLCEKLLKGGKQVIVLDDFNDFYNPEIKKRNLKNCLKNKSFTLIEGDIRDKELLKKIFSENKIEKVIHLAARAGVRPSLLNSELYFDVNVKGTKNLLEESCKKINQFIFASSSSVYGLNKKIPFSEEDKVVSQVSPYAKTKLEGEKLCREFSEKYSLPVTCLRFFTVYGPRNRPDMAVFKFTESIIKEKKITLFAEGKMKRDFTFVEDIVDGIIKAMENVFDFEIINLGNNTPHEVKELIKLIEKNTGKEASIKNEKAPDGDVPITFADIKKAKKLLDWKPETSLQKGIKKFVEWFKNNSINSV